MALLINIQQFAEGSEGNTGSNSNNGGNNNTQEGGNNNPKTYTQEELDNIVNERTGRATKSALKSFFSQKGLSEEEANTAIGEYLENKKKNTPDFAALQKSVSDERSARIKAQLHEAGMLEAIKQDVAMKSIEHVLKLADYKDCVDSDGNIVGDKLSEAIKKVLDDVPAFKNAADGSGGVHRVGGDGEGNGQGQNSTKQKPVPTKKWNKFNL